MKTRVGIVGFGNLGKAISEEIEKQNEFELVAIFSKRNVNGTVPFSEILNYKEKIDILFLCGGSQNELETQAIFLAPHFNLVEAYDNHSRLFEYHKKLDETLCKSNKVAISAVGWDPGLFSLVRGLCFLLDGGSTTFWGKGTSQGHTNAIKNIPGVTDAIQLTVPVEEAVLCAKQGSPKENPKDNHERHCFVVADKKDQTRIESEIVHMKDYFEGYKTTVNFVSQTELDKMKTFSHKGEVISKNGEIDFALNLKSNPNFTARVMLAFSKAIPPLLLEQKKGVFSIFDIPLSLVLGMKAYELI